MFKHLDAKNLGRGGLKHLLPKCFQWITEFAHVVDFSELIASWNLLDDQCNAFKARHQRFVWKEILHMWEPVGLQPEKKPSWDEQYSQHVPVILHFYQNDSCSWPSLAKKKQEQTLFVDGELWEEGVSGKKASLAFKTAFYCWCLGG